MKEEGSNEGGGGGGRGGKGEKGRGKGGWKGGRKKKKSLNDGFDNNTSANLVPWKKRSYTKMSNKVTQCDTVYMQPDQKLRGTSTFRTSRDVSRTSPPLITLSSANKDIKTHFILTLRV